MTYVSGLKNADDRMRNQAAKDISVHHVRQLLASIMKSVMTSIHSSAEIISH